MRISALLRRSGRDGGDVDPATPAPGPGDPRAACRRPLPAADADRVPAVRRARGAPGEVVRRKEMVAAGWPEGAIVHDNTLDTYVGRLRTKLRDLESEARSRRRAASGTRCDEPPADSRPGDDRRGADARRRPGGPHAGRRAAAGQPPRPRRDCGAACAGGRRPDTLSVSDGRIHVREPPNDELLDHDTWVFDTEGAVVRADASAASQAAADTLARMPPGATRTLPKTKLLTVAAQGADGRACGNGGRRRGPRSLPPHRAHRVGRDARSRPVRPDRRRTGLAARGRRRAAPGGRHDRQGGGVERPRPRPALRPRRPARRADGAVGDARRAAGANRGEHPPRAAALGRGRARAQHAARGLRAEAELALRSKATDAERRDALDHILRTTDRMAAVISTLLERRAASAEHSPGSSSAADALSGAIDAVAQQASARGIADSGRRPRRVDTRRGRPRPGRPGAAPAARQRDPPREHRVDVALERRDDQVVFSVRDDGPGLDPALLERIFDPGTSGRGSAGLGLALARRLARTSAGDVVAVPSDHGACFELRMPAIAPWRGDAGEDRGQDGAANPAHSVSIRHR